MIDVTAVFHRWGKMILLVTVLAVLLALGVAALLPKKFLSTTTAFPVNSATTDRARLFNSNIQSLYSLYGSADELDKFEGTAKLDTLYISVIRRLNLISHYAIDASDKAMEKAVNKLKKHTDISKTGYGQLRIRAWDTDPGMAAAMANELMTEIQHIHQQLQYRSHALALQKIDSALLHMEKELMSTDTASHHGSPLKSIRNAGLLKQAADYHKLAGELQLVMHANTPVLLVAEYARPAATADRPNLFHVAVFTCFASLLFTFLVAVYLNRTSHVAS